MNSKKETESLSRLIEQVNRLHAEVMQEGELPRKYKELIALGIALTMRCNTSIAYHVHNAIEAGASYNEISDTVRVAMVSAGEPISLQGIQLVKGLEKKDWFSSEEPAKMEGPLPYMSAD